MIFDCFTFFNELDLLEIRLHTLKDVVDKFVIAEATRTHTGKPKELVFDKNRSRFAEFKDKIVHVVVDNLLPEEEVLKDSYSLPWVNENRQRNALIKGLSNVDDDDVIIVSDVDEIPRPESIAEAVPLAKKGEVVRFEQGIFAYYLNFRDYRNPYWYLGSIALSWNTFHTSVLLDAVKSDRFTVQSECQGRVIQKVRFLKPTVLLRRSGWHMTYMGGVKKIQEKITAFSHQEAMVALDKVESRLQRGENVLCGRRDNFAVRMTEATFPPYVIANKDRFKELIFPVSDEYLAKTRLWRLVATVRGVVYRFLVKLVPHCLEAPLIVLRQKIFFR